MSWIRERVRDALTGARRDIRPVTGAVFWATGGSLATLFLVAPEAPLTQRILPFELGLLIGMALVYIGYGRDQP